MKYEAVWIHTYSHLVYSEYQQEWPPCGLAATVCCMLVSQEPASVAMDNVMSANRQFFVVW